MNRNTEMHFSEMPMIQQKRSKFAMPSSLKTSFNTGSIVPIYVDSDILPGDTVQMDQAEIIRMATPIYPIMDNLYADIYWFFVPHRLVMDNWAKFWGENDSPWTQQVEYEIPQIEAPTGGWTEGTIADYMGIPTKVDGFSINALPMRSYCKIYNDFFRDENLCSNVHIYTDETTRTGKTGAEQGYDPVTDTEFGGTPLKAAKFHDYFTSALPSPQKGPAVQVPLGTTAPVYASPTIRHDDLGVGITFNAAIPQGSHYVTALGYTDATTSGLVASNQAATATSYGELKPNNLITDLSMATAATISQLRTAFAIQKYYEQIGRTGSRYIEWIKGVFGVTSSDARLQRAEYLGGQRIPLNIDQILQTSSTDQVSPQGNTAGFSCTISQDSMFTKSFEEHGTLMGLVVVRTDHTYQQGLSKMWTRKKWVDFYNPFFANLSEQAINNENIYLQGSSADKEAFGYQEAWAEYRYKENHVTGYMRSNATGSLDVWHFADDYNSQPYLSQDWIEETTENVDRTIAVTSQLTHQFIADFFFKAAYTRCMPVYSIPGLIDHV